jgi:hypothetical protein
MTSSNELSILAPFGLAAMPDVRSIVHCKNERRFIGVASPRSVEIRPMAKSRTEIRVDFIYLGKCSKSVKHAQSYTFKAVVTVIVTGFVGAVWIKAALDTMVHLLGFDRSNP